MCQAYEAERAAICAVENWATKRGWAAHRDGIGLDKNPYWEHGYAHEAWIHGWRCRDAGTPIPWAIEREYRAKRERETGKYCYETPTVEQADELVSWGSL